MLGKNVHNFVAEIAIFSLSSELIHGVKKECLLFGTRKRQVKDVNMFAVVTIVNDTSTEISNYRILTRSLVT